MDTLKPSVLKILCERAGLHPEKLLGQNFLISRSVLDRIVAAVDPQPTDTIFEVGAGFGVLTCALAERLKNGELKNGEQRGRVLAIERDRRITPILRELVMGFGNVEVVEVDVLRWLRSDHDIPVIARSRATKQSRGMCTGAGIASVASLPRNDTTQVWKLAANLPYSITSDFFRLLFDRVADGSLSPPEKAILLLQREVVDRLTANPQRPRDRANVGLLTILTQLHCTPRRVAMVPPGAFWPPPKVESAIVALENWRAPEQISDLLGGVSRDFFIRFVRHCFAQRRRQLGAITRAAAGRHSAFLTPDSKFRALDINPTARPETLTLPQWIALVNALRT